MDRKALFIAILIAAAGAACLFLYMRRFEAETTGGPKVSILIATRDIALGEALTEPMLGIRELPRAYVEQRHVRVEDLKTVVGAKVSLSVRANEALLWSDLASVKAERRDLSSLIEPGMRAFTVSASRESLLGGLLRPGDRVDLVHSRTQGSSAGPETVVLLQNLVVLAVGADTGAGDRPESSGRSVTISVTPEQAQLIIQARVQGGLDIALRNPDDVVLIKDLPEVSAADIQQPERRLRFARKPVRVVPEERRQIDRVR